MYTTVISKNKVEMPSDSATMLFLTLCQAIDEARGEVYRYGYELKKVRKNNSGWTVTISDIGE